MLPAWLGPGAWHMTHTHTHSSLEESWRAVVSITELVKITLVQMAVQHYQTSQEAAECLQQCSCNSKHSRVLIALLHWEGAVGIKERKRDTKKKKRDAKQSICDKWQLKDMLDCLQIFSWIIKLDWNTKRYSNSVISRAPLISYQLAFRPPIIPHWKKKKHRESFRAWYPGVLRMSCH